MFSKKGFPVVNNFEIYCQDYQDKFHAQQSWACKKFYKLGARVAFKANY